MKYCWFMPGGAAALNHTADRVEILQLWQQNLMFTDHDLNVFCSQTQSESQISAGHYESHMGTVWIRTVSFLIWFKKLLIKLFDHFQTHSLKDIRRNVQRQPLRTMLTVQIFTLFIFINQLNMTTMTSFLFTTNTHIQKYMLYETI